MYATITTRRKTNSDHSRRDSRLSEEGEPDSFPLSTNFNIKCKKRILFIPMCFGKLPIDGLINTGAIPDMDFLKIRLFFPQSVIKEGPAPKVQIMVANGQSEHAKGTIEIYFEVSDFELYEIFVVMDR